jgi:hypothetical protein
MLGGSTPQQHRLEELASHRLLIQVESSGTRASMVHSLQREEHGFSKERLGPGLVVNDLA